jgi:hypothetical protein
MGIRNDEKLRDLSYMILERERERSLLASEVLEHAQDRV